MTLKTYRKQFSGFKTPSAGADITPEMLAKINQFALKPLTAEQVYVRKFLMAHNGVDRDRERFPEDLLEDFARTFPGKSFLFAHDRGKFLPLGLFFDAQTGEIAPEEFKALTGEATEGSLVWLGAQPGATAQKTAGNEPAHNTEENVITSSADGEFPVPVYTAPQAGTLLLASSWPITASSSAVTVTSPANWDLWSIETIEYNRLAVATYDIANDESVGGELFSQFVCDSEYATVMVFINPPVFEDTRLNLQADAWTSEDIKTYLCAHDGLEFENIFLALEAGAFSLNDLKTTLSAFYQTQDDVKLFLKTLATFRNDIPLSLKVFGQGLENIRLAASTVKNFKYDIRMMLEAVSPTVLNDIALFLSVTDGTILNDIRLRLNAVKRPPQYRSNIAQRLSSVISEVASWPFQF